MTKAEAITSELVVECQVCGEDITEYQNVPTDICSMCIENGDTYRDVTDNVYVVEHKAGQIYHLIKEWSEIYKGIDKRTAKAKEIKETVRSLSSLIGLI